MKSTSPLFDHRRRHIHGHDLISTLIEFLFHEGHHDLAHNLLSVPGLRSLGRECDEMTVIHFGHVTTGIPLSGPIPRVMVTLGLGNFNLDGVPVEVDRTFFGRTVRGRRP